MYKNLGLGSQNGNAKLGQAEAKRPINSRQGCRSRLDDLTADIVVRISIRRSQHRQRRRAVTETLKRNVKLHIGSAIVHSSLEVVSTRAIVNARDPVGRPERRAGCLLGGEGGGEGVSAEELEDLVRRADDRLGWVRGVRDQVRGPLVAIQILQQRRVRDAPDLVCVAFCAQGKDGLRNRANPVCPCAVVAR